MSFNVGVKYIKKPIIDYDDTVEHVTCCPIQNFDAVVKRLKLFI
jgi:hypothetical protein